MALRRAALVAFLAAFAGFAASVATGRQYLNASPPAPSGAVSLGVVPEVNDAAVTFSNPLPVVSAPGMGTVGGLSTFRVSNATGTTPMVAKASAGRLYSYNLCNSAASARYVRFYNSASPTTGTTTVFAGEIIVGAGTCQQFSTNFGLAFSTGISLSVTAADGDSDTTSATAGDVSGFLGFM